MDYRTAIEAAYDGFAQGDPGPLFGLFDAKTEWTEAAGVPYAGTYIGPDDIGQNVFGRLQTEWDEFIVAPDSIVVQGDRAVSIGTFSGMYKATGKPFSARFAHVWQFSGDKLSRFENIVDSAKLNEAL